MADLRTQKRLEPIETGAARLAADQSKASRPGVPVARRRLVRAPGVPAAA